MTDLLADLTEPQKEAVQHQEGPLLILAAAGSGKTRVITRRVAHLLQCGVRPHQILAITFTNKAAGEMRNRVDALVPGNRVLVCTFHSLGARILRQYADRLGIEKNFSIYDVDDRTKLVKEAIAQLGLDDVNFSPERIGGAISKAKNQLTSPGAYESSVRDFFGQTTAKVYARYEKLLRAANAMDFDDLLYLPAMALRINEEFRRDLDSRFQYVMVDEYQDTNKAQYEIARRISFNYPNLCVVGDPDQCLPPGTLIETPGGKRRIEELKVGDDVLTVRPGGQVGVQAISAVMVNPCQRPLVECGTTLGLRLQATANHVFFAREGLPDCNHRKPLRSVSDDVHALHAVHSYRGVQAGHLAVENRIPVYDSNAIDERSVTSLRSIPYDGPVYDITVPVTHNFIANGIVVHNSIYKWRGSDIKNILDFERDFPSAKVIALETNFRSTPNILAAAGQLIEHNVKRKKKALVTPNPSGSPVRILSFDNGLDEAEGVVLQIKEMVKQGAYRYRDFVIFLRINALSRSLESAFVQHGVPFQIVKGLAFYERKENKDVLAYLRLVVNPQDPLSFLRAIAEPGRGVGKVSLDRLQAYAREKEIGLLTAAGQVGQIPEIKGKAATGLKDFYRLMTELRSKLDLPPPDLIRLVLEKSGYTKMLKDSETDEDNERLANIEELITAAQQFYTADPDRTLGDFLEQVALASDVDGWDESSDRVSVMTLHAAKGLEFPCVFVMAVEQGLLPHERSLANDEELEEERRLCFVGMTRAMKELFLCHARQREFRGQILYAIPSMFLDELPEDVERIDKASSRNAARQAFEQYRTRPTGGYATGLPTRPAVVKPVAPAASSAGGSSSDADYAVGQVVQHEQYGIGQISDVSGFGAFKKIKVRFPAGGEKTFMADKVKLKIAGRKSG